MVFKRLLVSCLLVVWLIKPLQSEEYIFRELEANTQRGEPSLLDIWAVKIEAKEDEDQEEIANDIAKRYGMINKGIIGNLDDYYEMEYVGARRERRSNVEHTKRLAAHPRIAWIQQQTLLERTKRRVVTRTEDLDFNDPKFERQWYIKNDNRICKVVNITSNQDLNVYKAWKLGYTGKGVVVAVVDDGLDHHHPDLSQNYDPNASYDLNDEDDDPKPDDRDPYNGHGTKCAGEIAASANNGICGVGIAYEASIGGIRLLDGAVTDALEARALGFNSNYIDIYSNCWGPKDDGKTFGKPGDVTTAALKKGAETGRKGKGSIFVWATGNGGGANDDCDCDGYTTSIYTISIGAVGCYGLSTFYDEMCASTLAVTYTSGYHNPEDAFQQMPLVTTGLHNQCTESFQGTSSAAPIGAGIIALVLQANPELGWRDVQHLIVHTAKKTSPTDDGWRKNRAGFEFNHKFGFGLMDAAAMVELALKWKNVGKHLMLHDEPDKENSKGIIPGGGHLTLKLKTSGKGTGTTNDVKEEFVIRKLEHVVVTVSFSHKRRGDVSISLTAPSGTKSEILSTRVYDNADSGLTDWKFNTVHCWGEDPKGEWILTVKDNPDSKYKKLNKKNDIEETERMDIDNAIKKAHKKDYIYEPGKYAYDVRPNEYVRDEIHHGRSKEDYMRSLPQEDKSNLDNDEKVWNYERRERRDSEWEEDLDREREQLLREALADNAPETESFRKIKEAFRKREAMDKRIEKYLRQLESENGEKNDSYDNRRREYETYDDKDNFYFKYNDKRLSNTLDNWSITFYGTEH